MSLQRQLGCIHQILPLIDFFGLVRGLLLVEFLELMTEFSAVEPGIHALLGPAADAVREAEHAGVSRAGEGVLAALVRFFVVRDHADAHREVVLGGVDSGRRGGGYFQPRSILFP